MRGSGGTEGGAGQFAVGLLLAVGATYLFFDSVRVSTAGHGLLGRMMGGRGGGFWETTSMGVLFVPFFIGVIALFYNARLRWAWGLMLIGLILLAVEIFSRLRFVMDAKTTHLLLMIVLFAAGTGLMLRSYAEQKKKGAQKGGKEP
jgi:hypothetical protein